MNSGGRKRFLKDSRVRILTLTGGVTSDVYVVVPPQTRNDHENDNGGDKEYVRADRKGHIVLQPEEGSGKELKVHFRRVLPVEIDGKAPVIESVDKYRAICPGCGCVVDVDPSDTTINCSKCGETELYWLGAKPMTETKTAVQQPKADKKPAATPPTTKSEKTVQQPIRVDFNKLRSLPDCELWTKQHVKFDHPDVDLKAHALLFVGENPRKLCFNTYDGTLGKKSVDLPIEEFIKDGVVTTGKRQKPWYPIKDVEKSKAKLVKDGYEKA